MGSNTDLNNLGLKPNQWDVDFDALPTGFGAAIVDPPQPGTYLFRLPSRVQIEKSFEEFDHAQQGKRLRCSFRDDTALNNLTLGNQYNTTLSNVGRLITPRKGNRQPFVVSDLASLCKAVRSIPSNQTVQGWKEALLAAADAEFLADHTLTANCNPQRDRYAYDENVGKTIIQVGIKGCGKRYRTEAWDGGGDINKAVLAIPQDADGKFALRITCVCGAEVRAWGQLQGFRPAK
jgi:hypothetical protein